jgi:hypothetical protein
MGKHVHGRSWPAAPVPGATRLRNGCAVVLRVCRLLTDLSLDAAIDLLILSAASAFSHMRLRLDRISSRTADVLAHETFPQPTGRAAAHGSRPHSTRRSAVAVGMPGSAPRSSGVLPALTSTTPYGAATFRPHVSAAGARGSRGTHAQVAMKAGGAAGECTGASRGVH